MISNEWHLPRSLQGRLLLLGVIAGMAGAGTIGWMAVERYAAAKAESKENARHLTHQVTHQLARLVAGERYLLLTLSKVPAIRNIDTAASSALLARDQTGVAAVCQFVGVQHKR
jgi:hypothetical protein